MNFNPQNVPALSTDTAKSINTFLHSMKVLSISPEDMTSALFDALEASVVHKSFDELDADGRANVVFGYRLFIRTFGVLVADNPARSMAVLSQFKFDNYSDIQGVEDFLKKGVEAYTAVHSAKTEGDNSKFNACMNQVVIVFRFYYDLAVAA